MKKTGAYRRQAEYLRIKLGGKRGNDKVVAEKIGVATGYWSQMLNGHRQLNKELIDRIIAAFPNLKKNELMEFTGEHQTSKEIDQHERYSQTDAVIDVGPVTEYIRIPLRIYDELREANGALKELRDRTIPAYNNILAGINKLTQQNENGAVPHHQEDQQEGSEQLHRRKQPERRDVKSGSG